MSIVTDSVGRKFGRLRVARVHDLKAGKVWCVCVCGVEKAMSAYPVVSGAVVSCGCAKKERFTKFATKHGLRFTPEYKIWQMMKDRCNNPNSTGYENYGGRGIKVCQRWLDSFLDFFEDMGKRPSPDHSIERENNNGDYSPDNCTWADRVEQANNTRKTLIIISFEGRTMNLHQWSKTLGRSYGTLYYRIVARGWAPEKAFR